MAQERFEALVETFAFLEDWEQRYRHVIDMGRSFPPLDDALKAPATKVDGCASHVWLHPRIDGSGPGATYDFEGDSDAMIVKGLIAVLHDLYGGLPVAEVGRVDALAELGRLGLDGHLSSQRSNGLRAMVQRIQTTAAEAAAEAR